MKMLVCTKCKLEKDEVCFSIKGGSKNRGRSYFCKSCHNEYVRDVWYKKNADKQIVSSRKWKKENKMRIMATKYKITEELLQKLIDDSDGKCNTCGKSAKLHIDHCHTSYKVRGLLCANCNLAIGMIGDNIEVLENLIVYLRKNKIQGSTGVGSSGGS